jgi:hypothetical protein
MRRHQYESVRRLPISLIEAIITLSTQTKEIKRKLQFNISHENAKIFNKILANRIQQYIRKTIMTKWDLPQVSNSGSAFENKLMGCITQTD